MKVLYELRRLILTMAMALIAMSSFSNAAFADGTDILGDPSIRIQPGNDIITAGIGLRDLTGGTINVIVPAGATVRQVLLYWHGYDTPDGGVSNDGEVVVNGTNVPGIAISDPIVIGNGFRVGYAYRANITGLGLVSPGTNSLTIEGLNFEINHGAGVLVIVEDASGATIELRDGNDFAFKEQARTAVPQVFNFASSASDRTATLDMFFASVSNDDTTVRGVRTNSIVVRIDGADDQEFLNELGSIDGREWDTFEREILIPAGATSLEVEAISTNPADPTDTLSPSSFHWIAAGLRMPPPAAPAALGDRVWEDLNNDGIQDCVDGGANDPNFPADGIIGNAGDSGPECDAGIPDVKVTLGTPDGQGNCIDSGAMTTTDASGFYGFGNLDPADYCVVVDKSTLPADLCTTADGIDLGDPQFTTQNAGGNAVDSDVNADGVSDTVSLGSGDTNLTLDAGVVCPAKIGDRVWSDTNKDGIQDDGENGVEKVKVTLFECGPDMVAGTLDDVDTGEMRFTGTDGMYMFGGEPGFTLDPGKYFVQFTKPDGTQFTKPNVNGDAVNSDCTPPNGITACTPLGSGEYNPDRDCGLIPPPPPECGIGVDKKCRVDTPPVSGDLECKAKIAATVLQYTGPGTPGTVTVEGKNKKATVTANFDPATGLLTVEARPNDLGSKMTITTDGAAEVIHTSCSTPYVAGQPAPLDNPKGGPSANWLVVSFVDKEGNSVSLPTGGGDGMFADSCTVGPSPASGDNVTYQYTVTNTGDPLADIKLVDDLLGDIAGPFSLDRDGSMTFEKRARITETTVNTATASTLLGGEVCAASDTVTIEGPPPPVDCSECDGKVTKMTLQYNGSSSADIKVVQKKDDEVVFEGTVDADGEFTIMGVDKKGTLGTEIIIYVNNVEHTRIHTSCSQPIGPGLVSGDFTVIKAYSLKGGEICPIDLPPPPPPTTGGECDGKVNALTMKYNGGSTVNVEVIQKKDNDSVFSGSVAPGGEFSFVGTDKKGTLGTEIIIKVNGSEHTRIHTSCSQPIGPGLVSGDFEVVKGTSRNGGDLPPL